MKYFILLFITFIVTVIIFPILVIRRIIIDDNNIEKYFFKTAIQLDKLWCFLIWRVEDHTVSAMVFKLGKTWAIDLINWLFSNNDHCFKAWLKEFGNEME